MKIVITGASSGLGYHVAKIFIEQGHQVVACARRVELLEGLKAFGDNVSTAYLDVNSDDCVATLQGLLQNGGKADMYFHASGVGCHNIELDLGKELSVFETNCMGFARCVGTAYNFFRSHGGGHIAAISSIAGTMGLGAAPSYSASKAMNNAYLQCLAQLSSISDAAVFITDIRPGFVETAILDKARHYPMLMDVEYAAKRIVRAVMRRRRIAVIDWRYAILVFLWRLIPDWLWVRLKIDAH